jgi:general stress protein 26
MEGTPVIIDREAVLKLMDESAAVYLATVDGAVPRIRALVNLRRRDQYPGPSGFCRRQGGTVYLSTSGASSKVREIRANPAVAVYYCDPGSVHGISLSGRMEVLSDPALKRALWDDNWRIYWPTGPDDPDYVVLRMKPTGAAGWWGTRPVQIEAGGL